MVRHLHSLICLNLTGCRSKSVEWLASSKGSGSRTAWGGSSSPWPIQILKTWCWKGLCRWNSLITSQYTALHWSGHKCARVETSIGWFGEFWHSDDCLFSLFAMQWQAAFCWRVMLQHLNVGRWSVRSLEGNDGQLHVPVHQCHVHESGGSLQQDHVWLCTPWTTGKQCM